MSTCREQDITLVSGLAHMWQIEGSKRGGSPCKFLIDRKETTLQGSINQVSSLTIKHLNHFTVKS